MRRSRWAVAPPALLHLGAPAGAGMRGRLQSIDKPGVGSNRESNTEGQVLREFECLEVVKDQRLLELSLHGKQGTIEEEESVAPKPCGEAGHRRGSTSQGARELTVGGRTLESRGDAGQELRTLEIVGERKCLAGEGPAAAPAAETLDGKTAPGQVGAMSAEARWRYGEVVRAMASGTEGRVEMLQTIDRSEGPVHEAEESKTPACGMIRANLRDSRDYGD